MSINCGKWNCPRCKGSLYVIDSTVISDWIRRRTWCCIDCGWRYRSLEALDTKARPGRGVPPGLDKKFETQEE